MVELLKKDDAPDWFHYPRQFLRLVERDLVLFDPWWIFGREFALERMNGLRSRYPTRDLVPFARNQGNDDVACWERGDMPKVVVIHDYAEAGWEQGAVFDDFWEWFRSAMEDFINHER